MKTVGLVVAEDFAPICFAAVMAFEVANKNVDAPRYAIRVLSESGGPVRASTGMTILTEALDDTRYDTLLVAAGLEIPSVAPGLVRGLQEAAGRTRRIASICLGTFVLGEAGLLDGRRATTHWRYAEALQQKFPRCSVDMDKIFISDGPIWSSAGMTAAADLAVGLIERDHGSEVGRSVARSLVMHHRRSGGQSQHSALLDLDTPEDRIQGALLYARANLRRSLSIEELAGAACLSTRQFARLFRAETGTTPARAVEQLRLEAAKEMLEQSRFSVEEIARETGFGNRERMRRAFARVHGETPRAIRGEAGVPAVLAFS